MSITVLLLCVVAALIIYSALWGKKHRFDHFESDPFWTPTQPIEALALWCRLARDGTTTQIPLSELSDHHPRSGDTVTVVSGDHNNKVIRKTIEDSLSFRQYIVPALEAQIGSLHLARNNLDGEVYLKPALPDFSAYPMGFGCTVA